MLKTIRRHLVTWEAPRDKDFDLSTQPPYSVACNLLLWEHEKPSVLIQGKHAMYWQLHLLARIFFNQGSISINWSNWVLFKIMSWHKMEAGFSWGINASVGREGLTKGLNISIKFNESVCMDNIIIWYIWYVQTWDGICNNQYVTWIIASIIEYNDLFVTIICVWLGSKSFGHFLHDWNYFDWWYCIGSSKITSAQPSPLLLF